ncbi:MAG: hypothetical protein JWM19_3706 [Actinomycetia bacterium]|nr:hypothetical protein [Actinomycetes bacterium]
MLVCLALSAFDGRRRMGQLPLDLQRDVKELFGSYRAAAAEAGELLFSVRSDVQLTAIIRAACVAVRE